MFVAQAEAAKVEALQQTPVCYPFEIIIPHMNILSCDWLAKVGYSIMYTGEVSIGKMSTVPTGDV